MAAITKNNENCCHSSTNQGWVHDTWDTERSGAKGYYLVNIICLMVLHFSADPISGPLENLIQPPPH